MKLVNSTIMALLVTGYNFCHAMEADPLFQTPDTRSSLWDTKKHVQDLVESGWYKEAAEALPEQQNQICETEEPLAGARVDHALEVCTDKRNKNDADGLAAIGPENTASTGHGTVGTEGGLPAVVVQPRFLPGSPMLLDGTEPSIFVFDPRIAPPASSRADPWTGTR